MPVCAVQNDRAVLTRLEFGARCWPAADIRHFSESIKVLGLLNTYPWCGFVKSEARAISPSWNGNTAFQKRGFHAAMEECFLAAMALNLERIVDAIFSSLILIFCRKTWGAAEFFLLSTDPILDTTLISSVCNYFAVKQLKCILIYKMDIFITYYLPERYENTPYRLEWVNRRSLYIELNCSSTIYSGEKLGWHCDGKNRQTFF